MYLQISGSKNVKPMTIFGVSTSIHQLFQGAPGTKQDARHVIQNAPPPGANIERLALEADLKPERETLDVSAWILMWIEWDLMWILWWSYGSWWQTYGRLMADLWDCMAGLKDFMVILWRAKSWSYGFDGGHLRQQTLGSSPSICRVTTMT